MYPFYSAVLGNVAGFNRQVGRQVGSPIREYSLIYAERRSIYGIHGTDIERCELRVLWLFSWTTYFLVEVYNGGRQTDILLDLDNHR